MNKVVFKESISKETGYQNVEECTLMLIHIEIEIIDLQLKELTTLAMDSNTLKNI